MTVSPCVPVARLRQLIAGLLPEAELAEVTAHLDGCSVCQSTLDQLLATSGIWPVPPAAAQPVEPGPALAAVLHCLSHAAPPDESVTALSGELDLLGRTSETAVNPPQFDFLEPMDRPGYLGRLGQYEVTQVLGYGGMGVVLKAFDPALHRFVAVKVLAAHLANHPAASRRFVREARAAAAVSHEHVVAVHGVETRGTLPYLIMEYVAGGTLQDRLERSGPLGVEEVLRIGRQTAAGLAAAHAQGLIHRDVKPANILLENGVERVKLTDFGLARAADDAGVTHPGVIVGTPLYMAPEQARGEAVDHRADLFSLGSILYALCTGRPPFRASSSLAVLKRICDDTPQPVRAINADVPEWLSAIIDRLLAKNPNDRYQSAREVADLLERHLARLRQPAGASRSGRHRGRRWPLVALVTALAALAALLIADRLFPGVLFPARQEPGGDGHREQVSPKGGDGRPDAGEGTKDRDAVKKVPPETDGPRQPLDRPRQFTLAEVPPGELVLLPGGRRLLTRVPGKPSALRVIELGGAEVCRLEGHTGEITALAVSADGRRAVTGGADKTVRLWDLETGKERRCFQGHRTSVTAVALFREGQASTAGKVLSVAGDGTLRVWDADTGEAAGTFDGGKARLEVVYAATVRPNGVLVTTASEEGNVRVWDLRDAKKESAPYKLPVMHDVLLGTLTADGHYFLHANPSHQLVWHHIDRGEEVVRLSGHSAAVTALAISPDRRFVLSGSKDRTVRLWDVEKGREVGRFEDPDGVIVRVAFSTDGRHLLAVSANGAVRVWDAPP